MLCVLQAELGTAADFLESYELGTFDVADPEGAANDIVAGAVHGGTFSLHPCAATIYPCQPACSPHDTPLQPAGWMLHARAVRHRQLIVLASSEWQLCSVLWRVGTPDSITCRTGFCGRCFRAGLPSLPPGDGADTLGKHI